MGKPALKAKPKDKNAKKTTAIHPNSREARRLHRGLVRGAKLARQKSDHSAAVIAFGKRVMWFKDNLPADRDALATDEVHALVRAHLARHEPELDEIKQFHASVRSRPKANREDALKILKDHELAEYKSGFRLPEMTTVKGLRALRAWTGELKFLQGIPCARLAETGESSAAAAMEEDAPEDMDEDGGDEEDVAE